MSDFVSSYIEVFAPPVGGRLEIKRVEIPIIQRDYAQGRSDARAARIRSEFLGALYDAVAGGPPISLDFLYGDVKEGTFRPLDGQQRLTTLFLLHWYISFRSGALADASNWVNFSYATRESARVFCERLVEHPPKPDQADPAVWIEDQPWYRYLWQHDPTIQSMLVMIAAIDKRFRGLDAPAAWTRLSDPIHPAISFHVLPIEEMGSGEELYIKMNSRGKPLTDFETFKARFEKWIEGSARVDDFSKKVDGKWADLLWPFDTGDNTVDDEFMKYFEYLTQICEWRNDADDLGSLEERAKRAFGTTNEQAAENLAFLFGAFDSWEETDVSTFFTTTFTTTREPGKIHLFTGSDANLLKLCCHSYGTPARFGIAEGLILYAVLLHRIHGTEDFPRRIRMIRNLVAASQDQIRPEAMAKLITEIEVLVIHGDLSKVSTFNTPQIEDERLKQDFRTAHAVLEADVFRLEDNEILRGSLMSFALDAERFPKHVVTFEAMMSQPSSWKLFTGALLTQGDYSRPNRPNYPDRRRFGSPSIEGPWRLLLTGASRADLAETRDVLAAMLDDISTPDAPAALGGMTQAWLDKQGAYDWRYYLVRYDWMREGTSGLYTCPDALMGFRLRMLYKSVLSSHHREPFIYAAWRESGIGDGALDPWFLGHMPEGCWLTLTKSRMKIRCVATGWEVRSGGDGANTVLDGVLSEHGVNGYGILTIPQRELDGLVYDTSDRVQTASALLQDLVAAGL